MIVLDASALLAAMLNERGAEKVEEIIDEAVICAVNASEVISKLVDKGYGEAEVRRLYDMLRLDVVDFDQGLALAAGFLRSNTRPKGLSLGDRACLALALRENATALTADRAWAEIDIGCHVELIR
jgi:ribonuclease VapC